jgi:hypothetical protein
LSDERRADLYELINPAYTRVRKAADAGAFLFSEQAFGLLHEVRKEWEQDHEMFVERADALSVVARRSLDRLVQLPRTDLKLKQPLLFWR